ncbi:response regulator transcription factor [Pandoraea sp. PE-S2R-1]|uniref:response regulator transcription factor n=1 Tax=Pandoraea sp. PE-S2R-1 TaxID=1986994 RepID=UPI000B3F9C05|nr:response regulator [Pandoraea sp. PE-S2R-1]
MNSRHDAVIHVVDDDPSFRMALARLLDVLGYDIREYASAGEFLVSDPDARPGCLLLDLELGGPSGLDLQRALKRWSTALPIIFMSGYSDLSRTVAAMKAGAIDFLIKPFGRDALVDALDAAMGDRQPRRTQTDDDDNCDVVLDARETVVLLGISRGLRNKQIAAELGICERTVKSCRATLMRKFGAMSLAELLRKAQGYIPETALPP